MGRALRVLIVEDILDDADLMILALRRGGLDPSWERVETAAGLRAALAAGPWDAVLADHTLPEFSATAALKVVRASDTDLPFIVVSGTVGEEVATAIMRAGANDYVLKPNLARLAATLDRELREADNRRARRAAEHQAHQLAAIVDSSQDAILSTGLDDRIAFWNPAAERLFGYAAAEVVGQSAYLLVPPDLFTESRARLERVRNGEPVPPFETVRLRKNGASVPVSVSLSAVRAGDRVVGLAGIYRDVTEKKRAEEALRESENRLRLIIQTEPECVKVVSRDGQLVEMNPAGLAMLQVGSLAEAQRQPLLEFVAPAHRAAFRDLHKRVINGADGALEYEIIGAKGRCRWLDTHAAPLRDDAGRVQSLLGITRDITEQKSAQDTLRTSEQRYRTLVAATAAIVWNSPASGAFDSEQPGWTAFTGQTIAEHRALGWLDVVHPDDREHTARAWAVAIAERSAYQVDHRLRRADGEYRHMSVRAAPVLDPGGAIREWVGVHTDVTEQARAEDALRLRDRAIGAATQGLMITDSAPPDNPLVYVSPGFERNTGYGAAEVLGRNCRFLQGKDTDPAAVARIRAAIRAEEPCTVEILNYRKNGTPFWSDLSISPVRDTSGRLTQFVGVQTDVTARRDLEGQFHQAQKMEAIGQLAGGVAHDFNNLLTIINGYSDLLLQRLPPSDPSHELITEILKAGERSAALTRQLLAFSRRQVLAPRVLNLNEVVADTDKMLRRLIGEDVRLSTTLATTLWAVRADPGQIEQILMNLAVNARDAMPRGGRVTIETQNVELDEAYTRTHADAHIGPQVLLSVTDTGNGIPPEVRARIFEPFFTTKGPGKGTGLGLATVYGIVKQSGGHVAVYSEMGIGTTFKVYFPRAELTAGGSKIQTGLRLLPGGAETVLLAEDEGAVRALIRRILVERGYTVLEAADGDEAVRVAAGHDGPIHLLITDVVMPDVDGRAVAERVVRDRPELRVLFVSGYTDDAVIRHGVLREGVNFLQKPFSPLVLALKVRDVLDAPA
ncbi:PAS domain S-box protein [Gemmata sp. G18]|uniref:histidine kinase n=1 Tax=Gemmata palustris TaxID=2822762 RepID=A0ABS5BTU8_9BACT|nr:PAS domain S-box protein [Gemmata palustris]MBP3956720.1 PAS domain S-box protein [Gemmata palustris]